MYAVMYMEIEPTTIIIMEIKNTGQSGMNNSLAILLDWLNSLYRYNA